MNRSKYNRSIDRSTAASAERSSHGRFMASCERSREHEIAHVGAGEQQDEEHAQEQHAEEQIALLAVIAP